MTPSSVPAEATPPRLSPEVSMAAESAIEQTVPSPTGEPESGTPNVSPLAQTELVASKIWPVIQAPRGLRPTSLSAREGPPIRSVTEAVSPPPAGLLSPTSLPRPPEHSRGSEESQPVPANASVARPVQAPEVPRAPQPIRALTMPHQMGAESPSTTPPLMQTESADPKLGPIVQAPRGLRTAPMPAHDGPKGGAGTDAVSPPSASLPPPTSLPRPPEQARGSVEGRLSPDDASSTPSIQAPGPRSAPQPRRALAVSRQTVTESPSTSAVEHEGTIPAQSLKPEVIPSADSAPKAMTDGQWPSRMVLGSGSTQEIEHDPTAFVRPPNEKVPPYPSVWPVPTPQPPSANVPATSSGRQSRITIGRIDVQINNQLPAPPSAPPSPGTGPIAADILEGRFLNRFMLRP